MDTNTPLEITTCQICGRTVKSKNGAIAHHGYTRPDYGWQTPSCFGARGLPYEKSNNLLPILIGKLETTLSEKVNHLKNFIENPPIKIEVEVRQYKKPNTTKTYNKPTSYKYDKNAYKYFDDYCAIHMRSVEQKEFEIEKLKKYIAFLKERFEKWTPPSSKKV